MIPLVDIEIYLDMADLRYIVLAMQRVFGHGGLRLFLLMLLDEQPRHGYDLIRLVEDRFLGMYTPSAGTVYPRLQSLEDDGLVEHEEVDGRKVYRLTDAGRQELAERKAELEELQARAVESARRMAGAIMDDWSGSVRDIRDEIRHVVNDVRRQERRAARGAREDWDIRRSRRAPGERGSERGHEGRRGEGRRGEGRFGGEGLAVRALRADLDAFAVDVLTAARDRNLDRATLTAVREALLDARESVITALRSAGPAPSPPPTDRREAEAPGFGPDEERGEGGLA